MKNYHIDIQIACNNKIPVTKQILKKWITTTLAHHCKQAELTLRLVTVNEITELNSKYRNKNQSTNVLAFPFQSLPNIQLAYPLLGDIIICPEILVKEVESEILHPHHMQLIAHWAHITIHGVLHLLGFNHIEEQERIIMQTEEIKLLNIFHFNNPYEGQNCE